ncbi:MAG: hypothetical protein NC483_05940 [Ruminococcus sp.]|nr:hypothetical protein [Ruminococcus sp.]
MNSKISSQRLTLITNFKQESLEMLTSYENLLKDNLCRVPFGKVANREKSNTLPFHLTLIAWDNSKKEEILTNLTQIVFPKTKVLIDDVKIMNGKENSYVLYFSVAKNNALISLSKQIYDLIPSQNYLNKSEFHITIHIDKDYSKVTSMQETLLESFRPFELEIEEYKLYEIYPPLLIETYN